MTFFLQVSFILKNDEVFKEISLLIMFILNSGTRPPLYDRKRAVSLLAGLFLVFFTVQGATVHADGQKKSGENKAPWHILADEVSYDQEAELYIFRGHVSVTNDDRRLTADYVEYDKGNNKVYARGQAVLTSGDDILTGETMEVDLEKEVGVILQGAIFIKATNFHIKGEKIEKTGPNTYYAEGASVTTCDVNNPDWKITGKTVEVTLDGYGFVNHAAFWARKLPVLYTPFFAFPAKTRRQSGFLIPRFGLSERLGVEYEQPYFWAISDNMDATFYGDFMSKRGIKFGSEARYVLDAASKGTVMLDFLKDREIDDGSSLDVSQKWGYIENKDVNNEIIRPETDRYWFRMKHDQSIGSGFTAKIDLDIVSDQDYLREFQSGYTGFDETDKYFGKTFGRFLDDYSQDNNGDYLTRLNRLNLNKRWTVYTLNAEVRWNDNVVNRVLKDEDSTQQKLPFIELDASKHQAGESPFFWKLDSEYVHLYRANGTLPINEATRVHRIGVYPRVYLPIRYNNYFNFEPSTGLRETIWYVTDYEASSEEPEQFFNRTMYDVKLDLSTDMYNVFGVNLWSIDRLKHIIKPQIIYDYTPDVDQDEYPDFQGDRIEKQNLITYSLTNTVTARSIKSVLGFDGGGDRAPEHTYHQLCYFELTQQYDINKAKKDDPEPFSTLYGKFEFDPSSYLTLSADAEYSQYERRFMSHNVAVGVSDNRGDHFWVEHRYTRIDDIFHSIDAKLDVVLSSNLWVRARSEYNLEKEKNIDTGLGLLYNAGCWSIDVMYSKEEENRKYEFIINLFGLGQAGGSM